MPVNKDERSVMMRFLFSLFLLHAIGALSSSDELRERALSPQACSEVDFIVDILKLHQATPFCSSFLHIPTATTSVVLPGTTKTITTGTDYRTVYSVPTVTVTTFVFPCFILHVLISYSVANLSFLSSVAS